MATKSSLKEKLEEIVEPKYVSEDKMVRWSYSMDSTVYDDINPTPPAKVVRPKTTEEVQKILRLANETKTPVYPKGGGTAGSGPRGKRIEEAIMLDMTRMNEVVKVDEDALTVTAEAGATWGKLNKIIEEKGWRLGFKGTYSGYGATIGGGTAYNSNGYGSTKYGVLAEEITNITVVIPDGSVLETGTAINPNSRRYYRYAAGPDLTGLFIGSIGTLGTITEVTMRIYPEATDSAFGAYAFKDYESAQECYYNWLKNQVAEDVGWYAEDGLNVMIPELAEQGYKSLLTYVVEDVTPKLVQAREDLIKEIGEKAGGEPQDPSYAKEGWDYKFELLPRWKAKIGQWQWCCHLASAGSTVKNLKEVMSYLKSRKKEMKENDVYSATISIANKNAGHVSTSIYFDESNPDSVELAEEMADDVVRTTSRYGGINYKPGKLWYPYTIEKSPVYRELLIKLKKAIDPNNIMNPGALTLPTKWGKKET